MIAGLGAMFPTDDVAAATTALSAVFGCAPTIVDGERWAQFDVNGTRVMLAGTDRTDEHPSLAVKVTDLDTVVTRLREAGVDIGDPTVGPHERRAMLRPDVCSNWTVVVYESARAGDSAESGT